ncbi:MAG: glycoside hydrolase, partial [Pedobacter sp.]
MKQTNLTKGPFIFLLLFFTSCMWVNANKSAFTISLNGSWEIGPGRNYTQKVIVPGIHTDATKMNPEKLWYRREVILPEGNWKYATLELKGARFSPEVYVNGVSVSKQNGGMAPTFHLLNHNDVKPGKKIILEIALTSLKDLPEADASYVPKADQWRSNISSCLWNDVVLRVHGDYRIDRITPFIDFNNQKADISFDISNIGSTINKLLKSRIEIYDNSGRVLLYNEEKVSLPKNRITIAYANILKPWSPEQPNMYKLKLSLIVGKDTIDQSLIPFGVKDFRIRDKQFYLNNQHITLLGGTVVWHRWMRDQEGRMLGNDTKWFTENVILRLKEHGANFLRFHLGVPPETFLDLCDQHGLAVQYEWSFFHGMPATRESLMEQYPKWLDVAMRHPSVVLYHPYNETEGGQLNVVWDALNAIINDYPPLVMEDRDVIHIHKYWWSLFENLGLYYDNADQFSKAIMVDEFGGNYLDGQGMMGGYPTVPETFLRFLGRNHTKESRLAFHSLANAKVAEYWRRIGAAGASPFCILGSWNDGSHWFMGKLTEGKPKPVWNELTCAWSPQSVSLELWDRNFVPGQEITLPIYLFNDTQSKSSFNIRLSLKDCFGEIFIERLLTYSDLIPFTTRVEHCNLVLPPET